jgi:hypothetical protein
MRVTSEDELIAACADYTPVGFHGTSSLACAKIETAGFLPDKIFSASDHTDLIAIASSLKVDTSDYMQWLAMRSITFAQYAKDAINHVRNGHSGGQGLKNVRTVLQSIFNQGDESDKKVAEIFIEKIELIRGAPAVVYAVDLSGLDQRLVKDKYQQLFQYYWNPATPLPEISDIAPNRLIAQLIIT